MAPWGTSTVVAPFNLIVPGKAIVVIVVVIIIVSIIDLLRAPPLPSVAASRPC